MTRDPAADLLERFWSGKPDPADASACAGIDVGLGLVEPEPLAVMVRCPANLPVPVGSSCANCPHGCISPDDPNCPGNVGGGDASP